MSRMKEGRKGRRTKSDPDHPIIASLLLRAQQHQTVSGKASRRQTQIVHYRDPYGFNQNLFDEGNLWNEITICT
jgi:hypothetical protein